MTDRFVTEALKRLLEQLEDEDSRLGDHEVRYRDGCVEELHIEVFTGGEPGEPEAEDVELEDPLGGGGFVSVEDVLGADEDDVENGGSGTSHVPGGDDSVDARDVGGNSADASELAKRLGEMIEEYDPTSGPFDVPPMPHSRDAFELSIDGDSDAAEKIRNGKLEDFSIGFDPGLEPRDGVAGAHPGNLEHEFSLSFDELSVDSITDVVDRHMRELERTLLELDTRRYRGVEVRHFKPDPTRLHGGEPPVRPPEIRKVECGEWWGLVDDPDFEPSRDVAFMEAFDAEVVEDVRSELLYDDETAGDIRAGELSIEELRERAVVTFDGRLE